MRGQFLIAEDEVETESAGACDDLGYPGGQPDGNIVAPLSDVEIHFPTELCAVDSFIVADSLFLLVETDGYPPRLELDLDVEVLDKRLHDGATRQPSWRGVSLKSTEY